MTQPRATKDGSRSCRLHATFALHEPRGVAVFETLNYRSFMQTPLCEIPIASLVLFAIGVPLGSAASQGSEPPSSSVRRITALPAARVWLEGTSNLGAWSCEARTVEAVAEVDAPADARATAP